MRNLSDISIRPGPQAMATEWTQLPATVQVETNRWIEELEALIQEPVKIQQRLAEIAARMGVSVATAQRMWGYALKGRIVFSIRVTGWKALVDWRASSTLLAAGAIPEACQQWWVLLYERYKGRGRCGKRAYNEALNVWRLRTHAIPGYKDYPPAGSNGLPAGWTYSTFMRVIGIRLDKHAKKVNQQGLASAAPLRSLVYRTRVGLGVGSVYMFDDVWYDFKVQTLPTAPPSRILELCCMDLFSASKFCQGMKPEMIDDETGARIRLRERDMRFLLAAVFTLFGYNPRGTRVISEHGTARVDERIRQILSDASERVIVFDDSASVEKPALPGWYPGRKAGNFRIKSALEGSFGLTHNARAMIPGQTGSLQQVNAPEEMFGRDASHTALVRRLKGIELRPDQRVMITWPYWPYARAVELVRNIYDWIDGRTDHDLEGYEAAGLVSAEFRIDPESPHWYPAELLGDMDPERRAAVQALIEKPGCFRPRKMSPGEVFARGQVNLVKLPISIVPQILGQDLAVPMTLHDNAEFHVNDPQISPDLVRYSGVAESLHGDRVLLRCGETYDVFVNPYDPRYLLAMAPGCRRYIGRCARILAVCPTDTEKLHEAMGRSTRLLNERLRDYRSRHLAETEEKQAAEERNEEVIKGSGRPNYAHREATRIRQETGDVGDLTAVAAADNSAKETTGTERTEEPDLSELL